MRKLLACILPVLTLAACDMKELGDNTANIKKMEDTLFKSYPTVNGVSIEVIENSDVIVTLRDAELYNESDAKRKKVTDEIAKITVHLFEKDNYLKKGTVVFSKNETSIDVIDKKEDDMNLDKLLKADGK
jgi:hypothetical protein